MIRINGMSACLSPVKPIPPHRLGPHGGRTRTLFSPAFGFSVPGRIHTCRCTGGVAAILHAVASPLPKSRYPVASAGAFRAQTLVMLSGVVPDAVMDALMARQGQQ